SSARSTTSPSTKACGSHGAWTSRGTGSRRIRRADYVGVPKGHSGHRSMDRARQSSPFAHLANRTAPLCCRARSRVYLQTSGSPPRALVGHVSLVLEPEAIRPETERATVIAERGTLTAE